MGGGGRGRDMGEREEGNIGREVNCLIEGNKQENGNGLSGRLEIADG